MLSETDRRRGIPKVQALIDSKAGAALVKAYSREEAVAAVRAALDEARRDLKALNGRSRPPDFAGENFWQSVRDRIDSARRPNLVPVINATGVVIHTNLGRAPLAPEALDAIDRVARRYANLEYDLAAGARGSRLALVEDLICELTGAEAAIVVNNCAAAMALSLAALAGDGDVVVSRGELIEIGGSFRLPDVIAESGARLVEVGATNKTRLSDYERAIGEDTRALLKSHTSNFRIVGFTATPDRHALAALARDRNVLFIEDLGSGVLVDLARCGLADEPVVSDVVSAGADLVAFSGDKLLGGPQAGLLVGRKSAVDRLRRHPLARAMRIDKLSLAALEATLRLYMPPNDPFERVPVLRMLAESARVSMQRAEALAGMLNAISGIRAEVVEDVAYAGGGSLPQQDLQSASVRVHCDGVSAAALAATLRRAPCPVIGRVKDETVWLNMRTVADSELALIEDAVRAAPS